MKKLGLIMVAVAGLAGLSQPGLAQRTPAQKGAYAYIGWPNDGEVINSCRFRMWVGLRHMGVAPAGVEKAGTGHHHLIVDADLPPLDEPIPNNPNYIHFGGGQTEFIVELSPGKHTLQLLMGDARHIPHDPPVMSRQRTVTVRC